MDPKLRNAICICSNAILATHGHLSACPHHKQFENQFERKKVSVIFDQSAPRWPVTLRMLERNYHETEFFVDSPDDWWGWSSVTGIHIPQPKETR